MRTFITVFCIIFLLVSFVVCEKIFVEGFCRDFTDNVKELAVYLTNGDTPDKHVDKMVSEWEKQKNNIFVFENHNSFKEIEVSIYNLKYSVESQRFDDALFYANALYHRVEEFRESAKFTLGNLL